MSYLEERTIYVKTKGGEKCIAILLSDKGLEAYKKGEKIDFNKGHIDCIGDVRQIIRAEF
jgi:ASC-1-like (ASCH) protein